VGAFVRTAIILVVACSIIGASAGAQFAQPPASGGAAPDPIRVLDCLTFGPTEADLEKLRRDGLTRWLDGQLYPAGNDHLPPVAQAQIDSLAISRRPMTALVADVAEKGRALHAITDPDLKRAARQTFQQALNDFARQAATRDILRDLYAPTQLRERMTWFWFNHFNVHQSKADIRAMVGDYVDSAIRPHALGRFRDLLGATLHHPAMLRYLDNARNAVGHINENYAREIMELHTMGVGSGYTQKDVEELARILTGVGIDASPQNPRLKPELAGQLIRQGLFEFNPARHDYGDKIFLGHHIAGRGYAEIEEALDILATQPATARHVSRQIAVYLVSDSPPQAMIDRMTQTFLHTNGDIASVLRTMVTAPEFAAAAARGKFKDPVRYVLSAVRLAYGDKVILNTAPIQGWLKRMAEGFYDHETPDGYSLSESSWNGPGQLAVRFEIARQIGGGSAGLFKPEGPGQVDRPAFPQLQNALYFAALRRELKPNTAAVLDRAVSPQEWNVLFLASPDFMR